jgi:two-component sensor histidine kinase
MLSHQYYGILVVAEDNEVEYVNQVFCDQFDLSETLSELTGLTAEEMIRKIINKYADPAAILAFIKKTVAEGQPVLGEEALMSSGRVYQVDFTPILIDGKSNGRMWMHRDITSRKIEEDQIKTSLKEKEILLKEIHHRVKNNLAIIASILSLQSRYVKDETSLEIFRECENRVRTMAMIHTRLYQSKDLAHINFTSYVQELANDLFMSYRVNPDAVAIKIEIGDISPDINTAIPIGLILNELLSNALKHAFRGSGSMGAEGEGRKGEIVVKMGEMYCMPDSEPLASNLEHRKPATKVVLSVSDNGIGFSEDIDFRNTKSLGLQLVTALVEQLEGAIEIKRDGGAAFIITFKNEER